MRADSVSRHRTTRAHRPIVLVSRKPGNAKTRHGQKKPRMRGFKDRQVEPRPRPQDVHMRLRLETPRANVPKCWVGMAELIRRWRRLMALGHIPKARHAGPGLALSEAPGCVTDSAAVTRLTGGFRWAVVFLGSKPQAVGAGARTGITVPRAAQWSHKRGQ
ncbi:hypothetical protein Purlil1_8743 [Purpureocillium lilacinum]|uniref:Uncharacterized protein n=1 Tax=Purpureocillium lilacinum TaxID=33203 RepID=A0ABR0BSH2_PURLI|nr:hypothetical protein Purlil1_8743 [Purpureocillium lilacinum]